MSIEILETWTNVKKLDVILQWHIIMQKAHMEASRYWDTISSIYGWKLYLEYCAYFLVKELQKGTIEGVAKKKVKKSQIKGTEILIYKK